MFVLSEGVGLLNWYVDPYCSEPADTTCECGAGELACFPLNPKTGACYIRGNGG